MIELKGDLFEIKCDALCITTNGFVKKNGECAMGRGCAKQAASLYPGLAAHLGDVVKLNGNIVWPLYQTGDKVIISFPVKPVSGIYDGNNCVRHMKKKFKIGDTIPGWAMVASLDIIKNSAVQLVKLVDHYKWRKVLIPRPGCGAGELDWNIVKPELDKILDNKFYSISNDKK